jgi:hypothetical protein
MSRFLTQVLLRGFTSTVHDVEVKAVDSSNMLLAAIDADGQLLVYVESITLTLTRVVCAVAVAVTVCVGGCC